jgi:hypothetical protein
MHACIRPETKLTTNQTRLPDVLVPVHHVRPDRGDRGPRRAVVRDERRAVRAAVLPDGVPVGLLLHVPAEDARAVRARRRALRRLLRPLLLRDLRALPGVQGAHGPRLRPRPRLAPQPGRRVPARAAADGTLTADLGVPNCFWQIVPYVRVIIGE